MKLAVEALFEEVVFAPKSETPVKIHDFNAVGGIALTLTNMTPRGSCVGTVCNADLDFTIRVRIYHPGHDKFEKEITRGGFKGGHGLWSQCFMMTRRLSEAQDLAIQNLQKELVKIVAEADELFR